MNIFFYVKHTNRKSTQIKIEPPDIITVTAPKGVSDAALLNLVQSKAKWIVKKLAEVKQIDVKRIHHEYVNGELFLYLGRSYSLQIVDDQAIKKPVIKLFQGKLVIDTPV